MHKLETKKSAAITTSNTNSASQRKERKTPPSPNLRVSLFLGPFMRVHFSFMTVSFRYTIEIVTTNGALHFDALVITSHMYLEIIIPTKRFVALVAIESLFLMYSLNVSFQRSITKYLLTGVDRALYLVISVYPFLMINMLL